MREMIIYRASPSHRSVPTIEDYKEHLRSKRARSPTAKGELFQAFFLEDYLFGGLASIEYYARILNAEGLARASPCSNSVRYCTLGLIPCTVKGIIRSALEIAEFIF